MALLLALKRVMRRLTPAEIAAKELADAELELLSALTHRDFSQSLIDYNQARIKRLQTFLTKLEKT